MVSERSPLLQNPETVEPESLLPDQHTTKTARVSSLDLTRGLICLLMAIDHTFFISGKVHPTESYQFHPDRHLPYLHNWYQYGLRFVTHTCAPGFSILMGVGIVYFIDSRMGKLNWSSAKTARYILVRGFLFVLVGSLSMLPFKFLMHSKAWLIVDIIFTLGVDFVLAGWLVLAVRSFETPKTRQVVTAGFGVLAVLTACLTIALAPRIGERAHPAVEILWLSGGQPGDWYTSRFPPLSWLPMVIYGIFFGRLLQDHPRRTAPLSFVMAIIFFLLFLAVRIPGKWGNLSPVKPSWFRHGVKEFLWTNKYCPDLAFITLFSGINHLFITIFALLPGSFPGVPILRTDKKLNTNQVLQDIGTSPFAYYFIHIWSLLLIGQLLGALGWVWLPEELGPGYERPGLGNGWLFWLVYFVFIMYMWTVCRFYGRLKSTKSPDSPWRYF